MTWHRVRRARGILPTVLVSIGLVAPADVPAQHLFDNRSPQQKDIDRLINQNEEFRRQQEEEARKKRDKELEDEQRRSLQRELDKRNAEWARRDAAEAAARANREKARQLLEWNRRFAPVLAAARVDEYAPFLAQLARLAGPEVTPCPLDAYNVEICPRVLLLAGIAEFDRVVDGQPGVDLDKAVRLLLRVEDDWGYLNGRKVLQDLHRLGWADRLASGKLKYDLYLLANNARPAQRSSLASFASEPVDLARRIAAIQRGVAERRERERVAADERARAEAARVARAESEAAAAKLAADARRATEQREAARQAAAESAAFNAAAKGESAAAEHVLAAVRARWHAAGMGYDLWSPLPREQQARLVGEALAAIPEYERVLTVRRRSRPDELQALETIKAAAAGTGCTPQAAVDCMPLLTAASNAKYRDGNTATIVRNLATIECHAHRAPLACRLAGHHVDLREPEAQWQVRQLAYWAMSCALPGELPGGWFSRCDFIADFVLEGRYGRPDLALASDMYRLACVRDRREFCTVGPAKIRRASASAPAG